MGLRLRRLADVDLSPQSRLRTLGTQCDHSPTRREIRNCPVSPRVTRRPHSEGTQRSRFQQTANSLLINKADVLVSEVTHRAKDSDESILGKRRPTDGLRDRMPNAIQMLRWCRREAQSRTALW